MVTLEAHLPRGVCPINAFGALDHEAAPIVLLFMDAFGPRPALFGIAERLAQEGNRVLLPHLFYDRLPFAPLVPKNVFADPSEMQRLMGMFRTINQSIVDADVSSLLSFIDKQLGTTAPIGVTGYCMGGRYALTSATASPRVVFAASFHGANLAPDRDDSPHRRLQGLKARIYVGIAGVDSMFAGEEEGRLAAGLRDGGVDHIIETYAGCHHGFVMQDLPVHDPVATERHLNRLSGHLRETLHGIRIHRSS
jgi:carboxymethylenebutenolidase